MVCGRVNFPLKKKAKKEKKSKKKKRFQKERETNKNENADLNEIKARGGIDKSRISEFNGRTEDGESGLVSAE